MAKSSPAFQFYPESYLTGTVLFTHEQKGIYVDLLCFQWTMGRLPKDIKLLARLVRASDKKVESVLSKFSQDEGGFFNQRLEDELKKQTAFREKQAQNGLLGGRPSKSQSEAKNNPSLNPNESPREYSIENIDSFCKREGIGEGMQKDGFPDAWRDWRAYRAERGDALTSYTAAGTMAKCNRWGAKKATAIIRNSIEKSWKNLLAPEEVNQESGIKGSAPDKPKTTAEQAWQDYRGSEFTRHEFMADWRSKNL